jgi:hypothetical protein
MGETCGTPYSFGGYICIANRPLARRRRRCKHYIQMDRDGVRFSQDSDWLWARQQGFHSWQSGTFPVCQNAKAKSLGPARSPTKCIPGTLSVGLKQ